MILTSIAKNLFQSFKEQRFLLQDFFWSKSQIFSLTIFFSSNLTIYTRIKATDPNAYLFRWFVTPYLTETNSKMIFNASRRIVGLINPVISLANCFQIVQWPFRKVQLYFFYPILLSVAQCPFRKAQLWNLKTHYFVINPISTRVPCLSITPFSLNLHH